MVSPPHSACAPLSLIARCGAERASKLLALWARVSWFDFRFEVAVEALRFACERYCPFKGTCDII